MEQTYYANQVNHKTNLVGMMCMYCYLKDVSQITRHLAALRAGVIFDVVGCYHNFFYSKFLLRDGLWSHFCKRRYYQVLRSKSFFIEELSL